MAVVWATELLFNSWSSAFASLVCDFVGQGLQSWGLEAKLFILPKCMLCVSVIGVVIVWILGSTCLSILQTPWSYFLVEGTFWNLYVLGISGNFCFLKDFFYLKDQVKALGLSFSVFSAAGHWVESWEAGTWTSSLIWDCCIASGSLPCCTTTPAPSKSFAGELEHVRIKWLGIVFRFVTLNLVGAGGHSGQPLLGCLPEPRVWLSSE